LGRSIDTIKKIKKLIFNSRDISLGVNVGKLSTWSCFKIRMQDKFTISRLIINALKCGTVQIFGNNPNEPKFHSGGN
jgi:hypothetical protein